MTINPTFVRKALIASSQDFLTANETISLDTGDVTGLPIVPLASIGWENVTFTPPNGSFWASVFYLPNQPAARTIGVKGINEINGFIQIDFNVNADSGEGELIDWEQKADMYFHAGRSFTYSGQNVLVISSGMSQGRIVDNFYRKSLTVEFRSQLKRSLITP